MAALALLLGSGSAAGLTGNAERGQAIVVGAGPGGMETACLGCHGLDGAGDAKAAYPRLDGMSVFYLYKQLKDYAGGQRSSPLMEPIAKALDEAAMRDVAAYYARQEATARRWPVASPEVLALGRAVAREGVPERGVQPCAACHGAEGQGTPPAIPRLAGQHASYLREELIQWKQGQRTSDPLGSMAWVAQRLTPDQIAAVAAWYASLRPAGTRVSSAPLP